MIKWYFPHGLRLTAVYCLTDYESGNPFSWFPGEVTNARHEADKEPLKEQPSEVPKLKGNSFNGKMIEDLSCHKCTKFTREERDVDEAVRSFKKSKRTVMIKRPYQCGIAVY